MLTNLQSIAIDLAAGGKMVRHSPPEWGRGEDLGCPWVKVPEIEKNLIARTVDIHVIPLGRSLVWSQIGLLR